MRIDWAPSARTEFLDALTYIAARSPKGAARIRDAIGRAIADIALFPGIAPASMHRGLRQKTVPRTPYLIVYRIQADRVEIRAVIHAKRKRRR